METSSSRPASTRTAPDVAVLIAVGAGYATFVARTAFTVGGKLYFNLFDDAMVSMRFARNLADGHGLVWNAGRPAVEGYTNFLWTLWMALLHLVGLPDRLTSLAVVVSGALLLLATLVVVRKIVLALAPTSRWAAPAAMLVAGLYYPLAYWTLRGMETGLIALLLALAALLVCKLHDVESQRGARRTAAALGAVLAMAVLTRLDSLVPAAIVLGFLAMAPHRRGRWRVVLIVGAIVAVTVLAHTVFRLLYYGEAVPNTYFLKVTGVGLSQRLQRGLGGLANLFLVELWAPAILAAWYVLRGGFQRASIVFLLLALFLGQCAYSAYVGGDAWEVAGYANRYIAPAVPLLLIVAAMAVDRLIAERRWQPVVVVAGVMLAVALARAAGVRPAAHELVLLPLDGMSWRVGLPVVAVASIAVAVWAGRVADGTWRRALAVAAVSVALAAAVGGRQVDRWRTMNAFLLPLDEGLTRYGLGIKRTTKPRATVAVTAAGQLGYFSRRQAIDLLGKSDPVVARLAPRLPIFLPGHNKWDYAYSIGRLHPDVVAGLWHPTNQDIASMPGWGYEHLWADVYVRETSTLVDRAALSELVHALVPPWSGQP